MLSSLSIATKFHDCVETSETLVERSANLANNWRLNPHVASRGTVNSLQSKKKWEGRNVKTIGHVCFKNRKCIFVYTIRAHRSHVGCGSNVVNHFDVHFNMKNSHFIHKFIYSTGEDSLFSFIQIAICDEALDFGDIYYIRVVNLY